MGWWIVVGLLALAVYVVVHNYKRLDALISEANRRHGTDFTRANGFGLGPCVFFDPASRKLFIVDGKRYRVEDFGFVRGWTLKWVEKSNLRTGSLTYRNVHVEIQTNDYQAPLLRIPCATKLQGETWNARMDLLFR